MHLSPRMFMLVTYRTWEAVALLFPSVRIKIHIPHIRCFSSPPVGRVIFQQAAVPSFSSFFFIPLFLLFERSIW